CRPSPGVKPSGQDARAPRVSRMTEGYSIVVAGHGSRDPAGRAEFESLTEIMAGQAGDLPVSHATWNSPPRR
ncbi:hypothetical protein, partial [Methylogaea oryzae]|uniref:hypothetical protein n=1 Tax=Methylogaea oryzae TaxID=1295382 RepID=UPI001C3F363B